MRHTSYKQVKCCNSCTFLVVVGGVPCCTLFKRPPEEPFNMNTEEHWKYSSKQLVYIGDNKTDYDGYCDEYYKAKE